MVLILSQSIIRVQIKIKPKFLQLLVISKIFNYKILEKKITNKISKYLLLILKLKILFFLFIIKKKFLLAIPSMNKRLNKKMQNQIV